MGKLTNRYRQVFSSTNQEYIQLGKLFFFLPRLLAYLIPRTKLVVSSVARGAIDFVILWERYQKGNARLAGYRESGNSFHIIFFCLIFTENYRHDIMIQIAMI